MHALWAGRDSFLFQTSHSVQQEQDPIQHDRAFHFRMAGSLRQDFEQGLHLQVSLHAIEWIVHMPCTHALGVGPKDKQLVNP